VPATAYFQQVLGVPTTGFAFSLGDHIHAPNERFKARAPPAAAAPRRAAAPELGAQSRAAGRRRAPCLLACHPDLARPARRPAPMPSPCTPTRAQSHHS
jgi:hypothetical protein